jgi:hypothetical protein
VELRYAAVPLDDDDDGNDDGNDEDDDNVHCLNCRVQFNNATASLPLLLLVGLMLTVAVGWGVVINGICATGDVLHA